ncbi:unnamed protein product [Mesocestoides corti]|uniref:Copine C-terminal domain-containing protein n=1 Tax=Mesocestoides corti TaxID=53468 RepID=A0A158QU06_MESCO|nr:unnamed protein product [Mesocestoides corti]
MLTVFAFFHSEEVDPDIETSINVVVGIDLSSQVPPSHAPLLFTEAISIAKSAAVNSEYAIAIQAVVEILQEYDSDEVFPAFGFGTRVGSDGRKSHLFPLTGDPQNPNCKGVGGVLSAYSRIASETCGSAPPNFAPLIRHVNEMAKHFRDSSKYFVLLILTTGFVEDWVDTQRAVIEVRSAESYLHVLDQDFALLKVGQEEACRDNVQFVEMRRFLRLAADGSEEIRWNKLGLTKEVLAELPEQVLPLSLKSDSRVSPHASQIPIQVVCFKTNKNTGSKEGDKNRRKKEEMMNSQLVALIHAEATVHSRQERMFAWIAITPP